MKKVNKIMAVLVVILVTAAFIPWVQAEEAGKVNINAASVEDLSQIKGIGTKLAERIVQYRTENGPFNTVEDLVNVKGIGETNLNKIKDSLAVE